ncbi:MAG: HAMP domain-containing histidine kinase [Azonexus sp.]|uniref:sensor histidine kinase n=1 Tax=Azonexus sp. TaxID=1872668 RepID=UPI0028308787|nr:HAMP domain-containing sensor histidine kinase [Azonexus sp.]MDR0775198.1 HAMP domain-containing histidine kinase [Azonexus sp.]
MTRQPLARRILLSFTLLTVLIAGLYAGAIVVFIHIVEDDLIGDELRSEMAAAEEVYRNSQRIPDISGGSTLYVPELDGKALPPDFAGIRDGYQEVVSASGAWYVLETTVDGRRFILVRNQDAFEAHENMMIRIVMIGLVLAIALAFVIGRLTVRRVIDPVIRLAGQVRDRDRMLALTPPLAADYGDDELGQLAHAFDLAFGRLGTAVERERLFTSDVSHELRTPLMIVGTSAELLARGDLPEPARRHVERIGKATAEMQSLVDTFLQLARAQGTHPAPVEGTTLAAMADELAAAWRPEIAARGLAFVLRHDEEVPGNWHPTLLRVVINNLLRNALHYTERGEIRLIVGAGGFRVEDTGLGIAVDEMDDMFRPFVRGQRARGEGLGLGLSLVRRICEQQGWTITAGNLDNGGSCFTVRLI